MSCVIAIPGRHSVVLAVDTAVQPTSGPKAGTVELKPGAAKLFHLGHLSAAMTMRGDTGFGTGMFQIIALHMAGATFDTVVRAMPELCAMNREMLFKYRADQGWPALESLGEFVLAGWSEEQHCMRSILVLNDKPADPFEVIELSAPFVAPGDDFGASLAGSNPMAVADLMRRQVNKIAPDLGPCRGGRMVYTRLTRNGAIIERFDL